MESLTATTLPNGDLKLSADNETRKFIKDSTYGYWSIMSALFERYSCNGSFNHFDSGQGNPFIGLTSAPAIAEDMSVEDDGTCSINGRCWAFMDYAIRDDLEELKNKGFVIYQLIGESSC